MIFHTPRRCTSILLKHPFIKLTLVTCEAYGIFNRRCTMANKNSRIIIFSHNLDIKVLIFWWKAKKVNPFVILHQFFFTYSSKMDTWDWETSIFFSLLMASHEICCVMAKCLIWFLSLDGRNIVSILNVSIPTSSSMMVSHTINWK